jgi:protein gp37
MEAYNPWHGCHKLSEGCQHCYVYRMDGRHGKDASRVTKTSAFNLPIKRDRYGHYSIPDHSTLYTCFTSDFLVEEADAWRSDVWAMMKARPLVTFVFFTKRIDRLAACLPDDWGGGYPNVTIGCTVENQHRADTRLPIFLSLPIATRWIIAEPLLGPLNVSAYLDERIALVVAGGESGPEARPCDFAWVLALKAQADHAQIPFHYHQTGAKLIKEGKLYTIARKFQAAQAKKAHLDT